MTMKQLRDLSVALHRITTEHRIREVRVQTGAAAFAVDDAIERLEEAAKHDSAIMDAVLMECGL
jgi:hypothetical protein